MWYRSCGQVRTAPVLRHVWLSHAGRSILEGSDFSPQVDLGQRPAARTMTHAIWVEVAIEVVFGVSPSEETEQEEGEGG